MNKPNPALVTQRAVQRLPRLALLLLCAAWVIPGIFGRDPWRNEDVTAFGLMSALAEGRTAWMTPTLGGVFSDVALLPHWLGAAFILVLSPTVDAALAARLPFAILLALTLALTWYTTFHLARTEAAQPVAFAFGGEALPIDYARAVADGAVLAAIATLGMLQLGHETTPELVQLFATSLFLWALAAAPYRMARARIGVFAALAALAASGAPTMALLFGLLGGVICALSGYDQVRRFAVWVAAATVLSTLVAQSIGAWAWRLDFQPTGAQIVQILRQWVWFMWPAWLLALWTLLQWRRQWRKRHVSVPLGTVLVAVGSSVWMGGSDRALLLALPGLAVLAAFALPTLRRSASAAVDWFSVFFFTACVLFVWAMYIAIQTGTPAQWAANVARLAPGFEPQFSLAELVFATLGTGAWLGLVRWRTGRQQHALWKSLVLPAGGVALCWLLLMTLWLPLLDFGRSARPVIERASSHIGRVTCLAAPGVSPTMVASFEVFGRYIVDARPEAATRSTCAVLINVARVSSSPTISGWVLVAAERRSTSSSELVSIYRRAGIR